MAGLKAGDLCYTVAPFAGQRGAFVTLVEPCTGKVFLNGQLFDGTDPGWVCAGWVRWRGGELYGPEVLIASCCLRKVDGLGPEADISTDQEMLTPKPQKEFT